MHPKKKSAAGAIKRRSSTPPPKTASLTCLCEDRIVLASVDLQGKAAKPKSLAWLREHGLKVPRKILEGKDTVDQTTLVELPDDVWTDASEADGRPLDKWARIVRENMQAFEEQFFASLEAATDESQPQDLRAWASLTMFGTLIQQEKTIVSGEWGASVGRPDEYFELEVERSRYARMRAGIEAVGGWREGYDQARETHNSCARSNLDNSRGCLFSFVLPEFNSDGTHASWGKRDVPWASD